MFQSFIGIILFIVRKGKEKISIYYKQIVPL